jgi:hypothetical protein
LLCSSARAGYHLYPGYSMAWYRLNKLESRPKARFTYGRAGNNRDPINVS